MTGTNRRRLTRNGRCPYGDYRHRGAGELPGPAVGGAVQEQRRVGLRGLRRRPARGSATSRWSWSAAATRPSRKATYLTKFASTSTSSIRRDELRASKIMAERARRTRRSSSKWNRVVDEVLGNDKDGVTGVRLKKHAAAARRSWTPPACSWPSATRRTPTSSRASSN